MSYFSDEELSIITTKAMENASQTDDLWSFVHSTLMGLAESQGGEYAGHEHGDGFYEMKLLDVNSGAEYIQTALDVRAKFQRDRAENDKSG